MEGDSGNARSVLGFGSGEVVFACIGSVERRKGQAELLEWIRWLPVEVLRDARFVFVGESSSPKANEFLRRLETISDEARASVRLMGRDQDVGKYLRAADCLLLNSERESFPRVVVEAMAFGVPVITSNVYGANEVVEDGRSGFVVHGGDGDSWRQRVAEMVLEGGVLERLSRGARQRYWECQSYVDMVSAYTGIIGHLLESRSRRAPVADEGRGGGR
jgi:glycosyltransferase involved in cell wall biosynthesis